MTPEELAKIRGLVAHSKHISEETQNGSRGPLFDWKHVEPLLDHITTLEAENAALRERMVSLSSLLERMYAKNGTVNQYEGMNALIERARSLAKVDPQG